MAKPQLPIDGKEKKDWQVTSEFGWRVHPVEKTRKHHNGIDIWSKHAKCYIEAPFDGKVIYAGPSKARNKDGSVGGFGYYVQILFKFDGEWFISTHAHMVQGSIKVKVGQKIEAGTVIGVMGATGMVTGKHLHWEITKGKKYVWTNNGKGYVHPIKFTKAAIATFNAKAFAQVATPDDAPLVTDAGESVTKPVAVESKPAEVKVEKPEPKPLPKAEVKTYTVKSGDSYWGIASSHPVEGKTVPECVKRLQDINDNKPLHPGDILKLY